MSSNQSRKSPTAQNRGLEGANYLYVVRDAIGLNGAEKCVAMILVSHRNAGTGQCNLSYETIATKTGLSRRTVIRAIKALEGRGVIAREARKTTAGDQTSNQYNFHLEAWLFLQGVGEGGATMSPPSATMSPPSATMSLPGCHGGTRSYSLSSYEVKSEDKGVFSVSKNKTETRKRPSPSDIGRIAVLSGISTEEVKHLADDFAALPIAPGTEGLTFEDYIAPLTGTTPPTKSKDSARFDAKNPLMR